jgi:hypothetical protein
MDLRAFERMAFMMKTLRILVREKSQRTIFTSVCEILDEMMNPKIISRVESTRSGDLLGAIEESFGNGGGVQSSGDVSGASGYPLKNCSSLSLGSWGEIDECRDPLLQMIPSRGRRRKGE